MGVTSPVFKQDKPTQFSLSLLHFEPEDFCDDHTHPVDHFLHRLDLFHIRPRAKWPMKRLWKLNWMNGLLHSSAVQIIYCPSNLNSVWAAQVSKQQAQIIKEKAPTNMTAGIMARSQFHKENWCLLRGETTVKSFERQILRRRRWRFNQPRFSCRFVQLRRPTAASGIFVELKIPYCIFTSQLQY